MKKDTDVGHILPSLPLASRTASLYAADPIEYSEK